VRAILKEEPMKRKFIFVILIMGVLVIFSGLISKDSVLGPDSRRESIAIPAVAFHGDDNAGKYEFALGTGEIGSYIYPKQRWDMWVFAPVNFPTEANRIKKIILSFYDNNSDAFVIADLYRKDLSTGECVKVGSVDSTYGWAADSIQQKETELTGVRTRIQNYRYAWFLVCHFNVEIGDLDTVRLHMVIIKYNT